MLNGTMDFEEPDSDDEESTQNNLEQQSYHLYPSIKTLLDNILQRKPMSVIVTSKNHIFISYLDNSQKLTVVLQIDKQLVQFSDGMHYFPV